ncbi:DUF2244 domain-containing protein [Sphingomonas sp. 37zxx]|uniref:DUF2244 domain-containing protein n=1 Tax=Sphingomonas sp. 37zxx TaxID=1550073 RepID=UPI00053BEC04|nr:DUF2244 domain-containing protein [Sphingomonas sp. 37zxx]
MTAPRSALPVQGKYLLGALGIVATLLSLRFVVLGAWPVLIFMVLDMGALAVALHIFGKAAVPEERLRVADGKVELFRLDGRGRQSRISLPAFWTRLEVSSYSECDCNLWLVFRHERHAVGSCVSAAERRVLIPRISAALASARSRDA